MSAAGIRNPPAHAFASLGFLGSRHVPVRGPVSPALFGMCERAAVSLSTLCRCNGATSRSPGARAAEFSRCTCELRRELAALRRRPQVSERPVESELVRGRSCPCVPAFSRIIRGNVDMVTDHGSPSPRAWVRPGHASRHQDGTPIGGSTASTPAAASRSPADRSDLVREARRTEFRGDGAGERPRGCRR